MSGSNIPYAVGLIGLFIFLFKIFGTIYGYGGFVHRNSRRWCIPRERVEKFRFNYEPYEWPTQELVSKTYGLQHGGVEFMEKVNSVLVQYERSDLIDVHVDV